MICYVIPVSVANANYSFIHNYELILNAYFILLVILLIGRIVSVHTRDYNELVHTAQIDGLTAVYNKEHTQPAIDEFLRTSRPDALHAFLILDIDKFKSVNDTYGHAVGDKVLHRVGEFLKNQFRDDDIIGRVGGDEFVILMKQVSSRDAALSRVQSMLEHIRSVKHAEMNGQAITVWASPSAQSREPDLMTCTAMQIRHCIRQSAEDAITSPSMKRLNIWL